jgi:DNA-binding HxlR family transcriptional regulator
VDINHLRQLSAILGHKWDLVILARLGERPMRYTEIASRVREIDSDLTEGVLSKNLRRLAANGLLLRELANGHHMYDLTTRGRYIVAALDKISDIDGEAPPDAPESDDESDDGDR